MDEFFKSTRLLNPFDRIAEILFGLIMVLSFTCSVSVAYTDRAEVRNLLIGAIGCNLAWGVVDATIFLIGILIQKKRDKIVFDSIQKSGEPDTIRRYIAHAMPPVVASVLKPEEIEQIRKRLMKLPEISANVRLTVDDILKALALFLLMVVSTFPVVLPFVLIQDIKLALRVSNLVAITMMFLCGWSVARYGGFKKWKMSSAITLIGILLVMTTIALGG